MSNARLPEVFRRNRSKNRIWKRIVSTLAVVVVFCTVYALVLPAITMADDPVCGLEAHEHSAECYRTQLITATCPAAAHVHDQCQDEFGNYTCGFGQVILHTHGDNCYDGQKKLICQLPEQQAHLHEGDCLEPVSALTCLIDQVEPHFHTQACFLSLPELSCTLEETDGHAHGPDCYATGTVLSCTLPEDDTHTHGEGCYTTGPVLSCSLPELEAHTHGDSCYSGQPELGCTLEETAGHTHGDNCYEPRFNILCTREQVAEHTHCAECYGPDGTLLCTVTPGVVHVHDETCFTVITLEEPELLCQIPAHIHTDDCFMKNQTLGPVESKFLCGYSAHTHIEACQDETGTLMCTIPEHQHDPSCKGLKFDPLADMETAEDWEATLAELTLSGSWPRDILAVAQTQLGYRESEKNLFLHDDGTVTGYSRYGQWYGAPYIDWSAAFVSFCVHYADAQAIPRDSSCDSYIAKLEAAGYYRVADRYLPQPGDLIFLDLDTSGQADHAGVVAELLLDEEAGTITLGVIQGDASGEVAYTQLHSTDPVILGYAEIPQAERSCLNCDEDHAHAGACYQWKVYYTDDTMQVQATIEGVDALPEDVTLLVNRITAANNPTAYSSMNHALLQKMHESNYFVGSASFFDMGLMSGGESYTLPQGAKVKINVTFHQPVFSAEAVEDAAGMGTFLLTPAAAALARSAAAVEDAYQAQSVEGETYQGYEEGVTGLSFEVTEFSSFAVMLAAETVEGPYWTRVTNASQLTADGTYMIVSAEGNMALMGNTYSNYAAVILDAVKGNTQYYTIRPRSGSISNNYYWTFTRNNNGSFVVRNQGTSNYLYVGSSQYRIVYSRSANLNLSYITPENCWRIANGNYYLRNAGTGAFSSTTSYDGYYSVMNKNDRVYYYYTRDMLIFKLDPNADPVIPEDVTSGGTDADGKPLGPEKPDYGDFITPSASLKGNTQLDDPDGGEAVKGEFFSDASSANLEIHYREETYQENQVNDGKVMTDKSVIYGKDDYGAFGSYAPNTFSVALSTLGQEYEIPYQDLVQTPVDVVFVLDVSGSMTSNVTDSGQNPNRATDMQKAVNDAITKIMADHPANRVGIALYSGGAWEMLPLSRYTADYNAAAAYNEYLVISQKTFNHTPTNYPFTIDFVVGGSSLKEEGTGISYAGVGSDVTQGIGTYTQAGIAMGHKIFDDIGGDTTYTVSLGENDREYTVKRQPVVILLSDGEPTYSTSMYKDVLNGPHYGDGNPDIYNSKGIHGYNTILSANYYKRMIGIQYDRPALFYTIGVGIEEKTDGPMVYTSKTGDNYKRAVLNPTPNIIANLTTDKDANTRAVTTDQLKALMQGTYNAHLCQHQLQLAGGMDECSPCDNSGGAGESLWE